jgi:hypothetical protein
MPWSFEMKTAQRSKLAASEVVASQPLTKSHPRSPKIKTPKTPSATRVLKSPVQNPIQNPRISG